MAETFVVEQKSLLSLLSSMQPICTKRTSLDATASILFSISPHELVLKGTDLEISLQSSYAVETSTLSEQKQFLVNGKRLFDIIKELDGEITFGIKKQQISLQTKAVNLSLNIGVPEDFPPFPERIENLMQVESEFLLKMLDKVAFLIPQNNANPALNGLFFEISQNGLTMTTTDGHCLAQIHSIQYKLDEPKNWLIPRRAVIELKKIVEGTCERKIFIGMCGNQLVFSGETFNFFTKLVATQFPEYKAILERKAFIPATIDRGSFVKTLRRSACLLSGQFIATSFGFRQKSVNVSMVNKEVGKFEENLDLDAFKGDKLDVKFYAPYLLSGLQAFSGEDLQFYLQDGGKPIIFETEDKDKYKLTYLVMPVAASAMPTK